MIYKLTLIISLNVCIVWGSLSTTVSKFQVLPLNSTSWKMLPKRENIVESIAECGMKCSKQFEDDQSCNAFQFSKGSQVCSQARIDPPMLNPPSQTLLESKIFVKLNDEGVPFKECPESHPHSYQNGSVCCKSNLVYPERGRNGLIRFDSDFCSSYLGGENISIACSHPPCVNYQYSNYSCEVENVILEGTPGMI